MIKIRALNEEACDSDSDDQQKGPSREAQEAEVLTLYEKALQLLSESQVREATDILERLLESQYLQSEEPTNSSCPLQIQLRLGCLKTLGKIYCELIPSHEDALRVLLEAATLDSDNFTLWNKIGVVAVRLVEYDLAKHAFSQVFKRNPSHWNSIEYLITLSYVLADYVDCLYYCAHGLGKDPNFIKGLVFRDFVFEILPCLKESLPKHIPNSDKLTGGLPYEISWKEKYLKEVRKFFQLQKEKSQQLKCRSQSFSSQELLNVNVDNIKSWTELCRVVKDLHPKLHSEETPMRRICFVRNNSVPWDASPVEEPECSTPNEEVQIQIADDVSSQGGQDEMSQSSACATRRNSSDEKEALPPSVENGTELIEENSDKTAENTDSGEPAKELDMCKKKPKRDLKWWQLEGKRRSQRVRGSLVMPTQTNLTKERNFGDKLRNIIPESLMVLGDEEKVHGVNLTPQKNAQGYKVHDQYFGTEREAEDVDTFLKSNAGPSLPELVVQVMTTLSLKTEMQWPDELASYYLQLYVLYRSILPQPSLFCIKQSDSNIESDSLVVLAMLELNFDKKTDGNHVNTRINEIVQMHEFAKWTEDKKFCARYGWLMAKHCLHSMNSGRSRNENPMYFLNIVLTSLASESDFTPLRIPTKMDNIISIDTVQKKQYFVQNLENIGRVNELYEAKMYEDLIEILDFCLKSDGPEETEIMHRYYLTDAYFQVKSFSECLNQALKIIAGSLKCRKHEPVLVKCMEMLEYICLSSETVLSMKECKQVIVTMVDLLVANDQKHFTAGKLWTLPWCILHALLKKVEKQEAYLYIFEESTPSSVVLLKFAHKYISRYNRCLEDEARLLLHTLQSLVNAEEYADYEETSHCIEQAIFCLYCFPTKRGKIRHLADHNSSGIPLDLCKSELLFQYYAPKEVQEFDSFENTNSEQEALFQRILTVIPTSMLPIEAFENMQKRMNDEPEVDPIGSTESFPETFRNIYYLIADHHFKSKEWDKAIEFYTWDLALNAFRFDSWAAIALAKAEIINSSMNSWDNVTIQDVMRQANVVVKCFQIALDLEPSSTKLRIEFGSFAYAMHANYSRYLRKHSTRIDNSNLENIQTKRNAMLLLATECFEKGVLRPTGRAKEDDSSEHCSQQEIWIHHYMLGKVTEKVHSDSPEKFLSQYEMAGQLLHEQNAAYPAKISFNNSSDLAVEALEIYYRIHASIMSYIEKHEYSVGTEELLQMFLDRAADSPFMKAKLVRDGESRKKKLAEKVLYPESTQVKQIVEDMLSKVIVLSAQNEDKLSQGSPASQSSTQGSSSTESSSDKIEDIDNTPVTPAPLTSFSLSSFCEKIREEDEARRAAKLREDEAFAKEKETKRSIEINPYFKDSKYAAIISQCVRAFEECLSRFSAHHKSYFRISYTYFKFGKESLGMCKEWLLGNGGGGGEKKKSPGLFTDRKPNNFFNGIWRSPVDDIDRTGSFSYHMSKTVRHLIEVLDSCDDHEMLAEVGVQLSKIPDPDKQYLYNSDREEYSAMAVASCAKAAHRLFVKNKHDMITAISIFGSYAKLQKLTAKENALGSLLQESYRVYLEERQLDNEGIKLAVTMDKAFRYFQHLAWTTKIQQTDPSTGGKHPNSCSRNLSLTSLKHLSTSLKKRRKRATDKTVSSDIHAQLNQRHLPESPQDEAQGFSGDSSAFSSEFTKLPGSRGGIFRDVWNSDPMEMEEYQIIPRDSSQPTETIPVPKYSLEKQISAMLSQTERTIEGSQPHRFGEKQQNTSILAQRRKSGESLFDRVQGMKSNPQKKTRSVLTDHNKRSKTLNTSSIGQNRPKSPEEYPVLKFNTSPFRARANILLSPKDYCKQGEPEGDPLDLTPPKAHCHSFVVPCGNSPDVIDFSRNRGVQSGNFMSLHPEIGVQYEQSLKEDWNPMAPAPTRQSQEKSYPLPPKKKRLALNLFESDPLATTSDDGVPSQPNDMGVEIITLD